MPADCCDEDRREQLRQILLHELAHLRQGDQRGRVLFNFALPLLYVHPLYWWIRSRTYLAAELLADDWAAGHSSTTTYAGELIALVKEQGRRGMAHVGTVGIFSSPTQFYRRMEMLVRRKTPLMTRCTRRWRLLTTVAAMLCVLLLSGLLGVGLVQADSDSEENTTTTETTATERKNEQTPAPGAAEGGVAEASAEAVLATPDEQPETAAVAEAEATPVEAQKKKNRATKAGAFGRGGTAPGSFGGGGHGRGTAPGSFGGVGRGRGNDDDDADIKPFGGPAEPVKTRNSRRGDDDDGRRIGGRSGRRWSAGGGRGFGRGRGNLDNLSVEQLLTNLKPLHRDVLILRLQLLNRRPTAKEMKIRRLLEPHKGQWGICQQNL